MIDILGREYATVSDVKDGTTVEVDGDFTCIEAGTKRVVCLNPEHGLFIRCADGEHFLDGQLSDDGTHYVGLYCVPGVAA